MPGARLGGRSASRRFLPEGRLSGPMPWIIAIMMFLTILAAAAGLALDQGARAIHAELAGRVTVQVVEADADLRADQARRIVSALEKLPAVRGVARVAQADLRAALEPWLGRDLTEDELPIPALIDVDMKPRATPGEIRRMRDSIAAIAPSARVEAHAAFLAPLSHLLRALEGLALALVLLMTLATGAVVVLAARAAHNSHRMTIEVLHLMGATDVQIARLFQRRIAIDSFLGGMAGLVAAGGVLAGLVLLARNLGSELIGAATLPGYGWAALGLLPLLGVLLAMVTARMTVLRALRRTL